jgi:Hpt domain-containing protein
MPAIRSTGRSRPSWSAKIAAVIDSLLARFGDAGTGLMADIAAAAGDAERLTGLAHKLKGATRTAGATRLGELAATLERSGSASDVATLQAEWQRVCMALPNRSEIRPV